MNEALLLRAMYARLAYSNWTVDPEGNARALAAEYDRLVAEDGAPQGGATPAPSALIDMAVALQGVDPADLRLGHDLRRPAAVILAHLGDAAATALGERVDYCGAHNVKLCRPRLDAAAVAYAGVPPEWFSPWLLGQLSEVHLTPDQANVMAERIRALFGQPKDRPGAPR